MTSKVSPQMKDNQNTRNMISSAETTQTAIKSFVLVLITLSFTMAGAMNYFIIFNNTFQILIHLPLLNVVVPANVAKFFNIMCPIATYDIISSDVSTEKIFKFDYKG